MATGQQHLANREFYRALKELRGLNVLFLLTDGSAAFGRLEGIDDCVVNVLPPVGIAGVVNVRMRPPNADMTADLLLGELLIDVRTIAAVIDGPYLTSPLTFSLTKQAAVSPPLPCENKQQVAKTKNCLYRQPVKLAVALQDFVGQNVGVLLIGGWVIAGQLWDVADCMIFIVPGNTAAFSPLITLGALNVFGPPLPGGTLAMFGTFRSWINLRALMANLYL